MLRILLLNFDIKFCIAHTHAIFNCVAHGMAIVLFRGVRANGVLARLFFSKPHKFLLNENRWCSHLGFRTTSPGFCVPGRSLLFTWQMGHGHPNSFLSHTWAKEWILQASPVPCHWNQNEGPSNPFPFSYTVHDNQTSCKENRSRRLFGVGMQKS